MCRAVIAERFPDHDVLAEELGGGAADAPRSTLSLGLRSARRHDQLRARPADLLLVARPRDRRPRSMSAPSSTRPGRSCSPPSAAKARFSTAGSWRCRTPTTLIDALLVTGFPYDVHKQSARSRRAVRRVPRTRARRASSGIGGARSLLRRGRSLRGVLGTASEALGRRGRRADRRRGRRTRHRHGRRRRSTLRPAHLVASNGRVHDADARRHPRVPRRPCSKADGLTSQSSRRNAQHSRRDSAMALAMHTGRAGGHRMRQQTRLCWRLRRARCSSDAARPALGAADAELFPRLLHAHAAKTRASTRDMLNDQPQRVRLRRQGFQRRVGRRRVAGAAGQLSRGGRRASASRDARFRASTRTSSTPMAARSSRTCGCGWFPSRSPSACCRSGQSSGVQPYFGGGTRHHQLALQRERASSSTSATESRSSATRSSRSGSETGPVVLGGIRFAGDSAERRRRNPVSEGRRRASARPSRPTQSAHRSRRLDLSVHGRDAVRTVGTAKFERQNSECPGSWL